MKRGFTLVELLAVIVILAVVIVIAVPQISNVITQTKKNSLGSTAKLIAAKAEEKEIENSVLGIDETMTCASLVTLDDNYGNCTVTKTNGHWTVTINGSGRFAGYRCSGTKSDLSCSETSGPEYVYTFDTPYYVYDYTVTDNAACKTYIKQYAIDNYRYSSSDAEAFSTKICDESSDVFDTPDDPYSASDWFADRIYYGEFEYASIRSFADQSDEPILRNPPVEDYNELIISYTDIHAQTFVRWPGNAVNFDINDNPDICIINNEDLVCFGLNDSYSTNSSKIQTMFENTGCSVSSGETYCYDDDKSVTVRSNGSFGTSVFIDYATYNFSVYGCGIDYTYGSSISCGGD